jgi:hypothetical protein
MDEDTIKIFLFSIAGFLGGIALFFLGFRWLKHKRLIENTPTSKVRSIAMGVVEIFGSVLAAEKKILKSPFTAKDCVYYSYQIEELRSNGKHTYWATIKKGSEKVHFFLKDNTGEVLVDPEKAKVDVPVSFRCESKWGKDPPKEVMDFLRKTGINFESLFGINKTMRFTEIMIPISQPLYIFGTAGDNPFVEEGTAKKNEQDIMIQKGNDIYLISTKQEKDLVKSFAWKAAAGIFGGAALSIICLIVIFISLNLI